MRRLAVSCSAAAASSLVASAATSAPITTPARSIYTTWGSVPCESWATKVSWLSRITSKSEYRSFEFWHVPEADIPNGLRMNSVEQYLLSCIEDDTNRLLHLSWGYDFDPFWRDRVNSHDMLFRIIYMNEFPIYKFIFGNCEHKTKEKEYMEKKLNYLKNVLHWANMTERRFTAITKARYFVQRKVWNALERERYLCACVEAVESFRKKVPEEFREKSMAELDMHLTNLRHWVNDCPNGKRTFTRQLA